MFLSISRMYLPAACIVSLLFFFNDTATTAIYTLSLHDALPIYRLPAHLRQYRRGGPGPAAAGPAAAGPVGWRRVRHHRHLDRKSTRLNSSHITISYAVFCLKKKKKTT